jgi:hypothetical protein
LQGVLKENRLERISSLLYFLLCYVKSARKLANQWRGRLIANELTKAVSD